MAFSKKKTKKAGAKKRVNLDEELAKAPKTSATNYQVYIRSKLTPRK